MATKCCICGGTAGRIIPEEGHYLCQELKKRGLPTPSLGETCPVCNGTGSLGKGGVPLFFDMGPAAIRRSIDAQFPPCLKCGGKGYVKN